MKTWRPDLARRTERWSFAGAKIAKYFIYQTFLQNL